MRKTMTIGAMSLVICLLGFSARVLGQDSELFKLLFAEPTKKTADLKRLNADLLAPTSFGEATALYNRALEDFRKGREATEVRKRLNEMNENLKKVDLALWNGKTIFKDALKAREDALNARASEVTAADFNKAEETLKDAGEAVEIGDTNKARQKAGDAVNRYRDSELNAIKISVIGPARDAVNAALKNKADEMAPKTYANAKSLLTLAEETLNSNRYAVAEATEKAEKAGYEARHAMQITRYLKEKKRTPEEIALFYEDAMASVGKELGFSAAFDTVLQKPTQNMISAIKSLKEERVSLLKDIKERDQSYNQAEQKYQQAEQNYQKQISTLLAKAENQKQAFEEKAAGLQGELLVKQRELEAKQKREAKIVKVREMFDASEASVVLDGNRLIVRLLGLSFPSGKSVIQPEYFGLLAKVERALREYPNSKVYVEGHTDNVGDERYNERLSAQRAEAVQTYLVANNATARELLEAVGYGESRPVANNETSEGRSQNRRIDVVIDME
jgi:OmpA-OmpF porin, OOP family